jgi:O-antigen/teichoic acid export membrane protein
MIKLVAEAQARNDSKQINALFSLTVWLYLAIVVLGCVAVFAFGDVITRSLINVADATKYTSLVQSYVVVALSNLLVLPFSGILRGLQRYDQSNGLEMGTALLNAASSAILLLLGFGLSGLLMGAALAALWRLLSYFWRVRSEIPELKLRHLERSDLQLYKSLINLSPADLSVRIYQAVTQSIIRFSLVAYAGVAFVGIYEIARRVVSQVNSMSSVIFVPMLPAVSMLETQEQQNTIGRLLEKALLYLCMLGVPFVCFLFFFYDPIIRVWLGSVDVQAISLAGRFLLLTSFMDLLTGPIMAASIGMGTALLQVFKIVTALVLHIILIPILGHAFGFMGVLIGESLSVLAGTFTGLALFQKWWGIRDISMVVRALIRVITITLPISLVLWVIWMQSNLHPIWQTLPGWASVLALYLGTTAILYRLSGLITDYEVNLFFTAIGLKRKQTN